MKHFKVTMLAIAIILPVVAFFGAIYGPQSLVPPPQWPFTADSRKQYQPFSENSRLVVKTWFMDMAKGRFN